jgi:hypothetical protein
VKNAWFVGLTIYLTVLTMAVAGMFGQILAIRSRLDDLETREDKVEKVARWAIEEAAVPKSEPGPMPRQVLSPEVFSLYQAQTATIDRYEKSLDGLRVLMPAFCQFEMGYTGSPLRPVHMALVNGKKYHWYPIPWEYRPRPFRPPFDGFGNRQRGPW